MTATIEEGAERIEILGGRAIFGENNEDEEGLYLFFNDGEPILRYRYTIDNQDAGDTISIAGQEHIIIDSGEGLIILGAVN
jgi:hypothetical protein